MTLVIGSITRYIVTYFTIIRYFYFIVWHCVVASTLYYDKKTPKFARPSTGPPPPPILEKSQSACFLHKIRICERFSHKPKNGCFRKRVLKVSGANSKLDIFPGLRQKNANPQHTINGWYAHQMIYGATTCCVDTIFIPRGYQLLPPNIVMFYSFSIATRFATFRITLAMLPSLSPSVTALDSLK